MSQNVDGFVNGNLHRSRLHILLNEKDIEVRRTVNQLLEQCNYRVTSVSSAKEVLQVLTNQRVDLILSEVQVPTNVEGYCMLRMIIREESLHHIPVIMMSSRQDSRAVMRCLRYGAVDFLVKPLRTNELINLWTHVWKRRRELGVEEPYLCEGLNLSDRLPQSDASDSNAGSSELFSDDSRGRRAVSSMSPPPARKKTMLFHDGAGSSKDAEESSAREQAVKPGSTPSPARKANQKDLGGASGSLSPPRACEQVLGAVPVKIGQHSAFLDYSHVRPLSAPVSGPPAPAGKVPAQPPTKSSKGKQQLATSAPAVEVSPLNTAGSPPGFQGSAMMPRAVHWMGPRGEGSHHAPQMTSMPTRPVSIAAAPNHLVGVSQQQVSSGRGGSGSGSNPTMRTPSPVDTGMQAQASLKTGGGSGFQQQLGLGPMSGPHAMVHGSIPSMSMAMAPAACGPPHPAMVGSMMPLPMSAALLGPSSVVSAAGLCASANGLAGPVSMGLKHGSMVLPMGPPPSRLVGSDGHEGSNNGWSTPAAACMMDSVNAVRLGQTEPLPLKFHGGGMRNDATHMGMHLAAAMRPLPIPQMPLSGPGIAAMPTTLVHPTTGLPMVHQIFHTGLPAADPSVVMSGALGLAGGLPSVLPIGAGHGLGAAGHFPFFPAMHHHASQLAGMPAPATIVRPQGTWTGLPPPTLIAAGGGAVQPQDRKGELAERREAALSKFRQKRKDRNFEKKIRYHTRKTLAERRPRVRGQFVRQKNGGDDGGEGDVDRDGDGEGSGDVDEDDERDGEEDYYEVDDDEDVDEVHRNERPASRQRYENV